MNFLKKLNFCQKNVLHFESVIARRIICCQFVHSFDLTLYTHVAHKTHPIYTWTNNTPWHYTISTLHWSKRPFDWPHTLLSLTCPMARNVHPPRHLIFTSATVYIDSLAFVSLPRVDIFTRLFLTSRWLEFSN